MTIVSRLDSCLRKNDKASDFVRFLCIISTLAFCLSSCGFHPIYKNDTVYTLPAISIAPINSIEGAELYKHLIDIIGNDENAKYQLQITLEYLSSPLVISKDSDIIEQSMALIVHMNILDKQAAYILHSENFRLIGSYNTIFSSYISHAEEDITKINLAKRAADEIQKRLSIFYSHPPFSSSRYQDSKN